MVCKYKMKIKRIDKHYKFAETTSGEEILLIRNFRILLTTLYVKNELYSYFCNKKNIVNKLYYDNKTLKERLKEFKDKKLI